MNNGIGYLEEEGFNGGTTIRLFETLIPTRRAALAISLIEKWGMVAGQDDGEDTAGRHKIRLSTPKEIVDRAIETADLFMQAIEAKDWLFEIPEPKPSKPREKRESTLSRVS